MMKTQLRREEYTALGDFLMPSFVRDQAVIAATFPKMNAAFLAAFTDKLELVKKLESSVVKTEQQKTVTKSLYQAVVMLNNELTVLSNYAADAGINKGPVTNLKRDLSIRNVEGALVKIEALEQYIAHHKAVLEDEGMPPDFMVTLEGYIANLSEKNTLQNQYMNDLKKLTETNSKQYDELYIIMLKIANKGKLVFKDSVTKDEYSIRKNIMRMRAPKHKDEGQNAA